MSLTQTIAFHVGPYAYTLIVSDGGIFDDEGFELDGLAVEAHRLLILSRSLDVDRRAEIAFHEYMHAWGFHVPEPRNEEERCNLASMVRLQFDRDLATVGGEAALRDMRPTRLGTIGRPSRQAQRRRTIEAQRMRSALAGCPGGPAMRLAR